MSQVRPKFAGLSRSAVALFRLGTYRARMAAALMIVAGSLLCQTGAEALEQSSRKVLYLDAPSVSVPRAEKAGETARGYAGPDSNVDDAVLAWVDVKLVPQEARKAFASITDPSGQPPGGVSYNDAVGAGDAMVAQLGGDSPAPPASEDDELASADPVRPKLGDGTKATDAPMPDGEDPQPNTGSGPEPAAPESGSQEPEYATADSPAPTDLGLPAPMAEEYAPEPSTDQPAEQPRSSSGGELATVPKDSPESTEEGAGGNSVTGPISDDYAPDAASPEPSGSDPSDDSPGAADKAEPQDETESGSSNPDLNPQDHEASPTIVVPDSPASDEPEQEPEPEYAAAPEDSGTEPKTSETPTSETPTSETATSEPENTVTPQDEPSSEPSSEPSPSSTEEEPVPAQDASPGTGEQEPEESSDLVAVVPYDSGAEESQNENQEGRLEQSSSQPSEELPAELPEEPTAESSSGPSTDETESYSPGLEPEQQGAPPEQAYAPPTPEEQEATGEGPALQPEAEPNAELGAGEDTEDTGTEEELPEGVQIESSDEIGVQKLSVVVHQESEATDTPGSDLPKTQRPAELASSEPPEAEQPPRPATSDQPGDTPGRNSKSGDNSRMGHNDHRGFYSPPAPQPAPGDGQEPSSPAPSESSPSQSQGIPETTSKPGTGRESSAQTTLAAQPRRGDQRPGHERVAKQGPAESTPDLAPAPKDQTPPRNAEKAGQIRNPAQNQRTEGGKQRRPQPEQQPPPQPAREPRQSTALAKASPAPTQVSPAEQGESTGVQGPTQSAEAVQISAQAEPQAEPAPVQDSRPPAPTAATNMPKSNEAASALQNQRVVTTEPVAQPPAASQAEPEVAPEPAPAVQPAVQTYADPATEEVADPNGWADPAQAQAARQTARQVNPVDSYTQEALGNPSEITTPPENIANPYADSYVEPAASSYEAPAVQDATGLVEGVFQDGYVQDAADPYVEDVAANAAPASQPASQLVSEPITYGAAVDSTSYEDPAVLPETYANPAPAETYAAPVTQVPVQQLEPVQQVPTQELAPAPQAVNVLESGPTVAQPSVAPTGSASGSTSPAPVQQAQQQVASTVDTTVQQAIGAGGVNGGIAGGGK